MKRFGLYVAVLSALVLIPKLYAEDAKINLKAAKCPLSGKAVSEASCTEVNGGKVYFCCDNCKGKFSKDDAKQAAKANAQLVATKQFVQSGCPLSGRALDKEQSVKVGGVKVAFCCGNCKGKVEGMDEAAAVEKVFASESFAKNFKKASDKKPAPKS